MKLRPLKLGTRAKPARPRRVALCDVSPEDRCEEHRPQRCLWCTLTRRNRRLPQLGRQACKRSSAQYTGTTVG
eukprot:363669-Chlamydomonas_euryale.AAC.4